MSTGSDLESNIAALKKLRELPRGTQIDMRINGIKNLLGDAEIFKTLQNLRWPLGVLCPVCGSSNVRMTSSPANAPDKRNYYECLNCEDDGNPTEFDDLTDLNLGDTLGELRQWVLCWYLIGFCSVSQIAKVLGLSMQEVILMAEQGARLTELQDKAIANLEKNYFLKSKGKARELEKKKEVLHEELKTRSKSLGKFKPGPKSSA